MVDMHDDVTQTALQRDDVKLVGRPKNARLPVIDGLIEDISCCEEKKAVGD
jgi:hypothetical protein